MAEGEGVKVYPPAAEATASAHGPTVSTALAAGVAVGTGTAHDAEAMRLQWESARVPRSRADAAAYASARLGERTARRIRRTAELTAEGLKRREIGAIIAQEEGETTPFTVETVKTWRAKAKRPQP